ncbi:MAG: response regulator [Myxococcales bacterium]
MARADDVGSTGQGALRILVAEDDVHTRNLLRDLCESSGFVVELAEDGEDALQKLGWEPDLVILDLMMPRLDGYGVLKQLRAEPRWRELPVIILTAVNDVEGKLRGIELGADDYVTKPFKLVELQSRIRAAVAVRGYRDRLKALEHELAALKSPDQSEDTFAQLKAGLEYEMTRARRYGRPLSALVTSIDDFGILREQLGAAECDRVTTAVLQKLRDGLRTPDRIYRLDHETFVALLPETDSAGASRAAERLVRDVGGIVIPRPRPLGLYVGLASFPEQSCQNADELLREANRAHEAAARDGAGAIVVAGRLRRPA